MTGPQGTADKSLGEAVTDVTDKATLLIREEIELAKTELSEKISSIVKGAAVGAAAAVFAVFMLIYLLHGLAYLAWDGLTNSDNIWIGYFVVTGVLLLLTVAAGLLGLRWIKKGAPPTPNMAIEEARLTREAFGDGRR